MTSLAGGPGRTTAQGGPDNGGQEACSPMGTRPSCGVGTASRSLAADEENSGPGREN